MLLCFFFHKHVYTWQGEAVGRVWGEGGHDNSKRLLREERGQQQQQQVCAYCTYKHPDSFRCVSLAVTVKVTCAADDTIWEGVATRGAGMSVLIISHPSTMLVRSMLRPLSIQSTKHKRQTSVHEAGPEEVIWMGNFSRLSRCLYSAMLYTYRTRRNRPRVRVARTKMSNRAVGDDEQTTKSVSPTCMDWKRRKSGVCGADWILTYNGRHVR